MKTYYSVLLFLFITFNSTAQNQPPVIVNDTLYVNSATTITFNPLVNDYDPNGYKIRIFGIYSMSSSFWLVEHTDTTITVSITFLPKTWDSIYYEIVNEKNVHSAQGKVILNISPTPNLLDSLTVNNIRASFYPLGNFFWDHRGRSLFKVPAGSNGTTIFTSEPAIGGLDTGNNLHLAGNRYFGNGTDYYPGAVRKMQNFYNAPIPFYRIWKLTKNEIEFHKLVYSLPFYTPPEAILNWPAHGDTSLGESFYMAPFFDNNNDGIYNPSDGDYPQIKGDQAIFSIFNDDMPHTETQGNPLKIEIHQLSYAYNCPGDTALFNTVFVHYDIYNRSLNNYHNLYFSLFTDFDIDYSYDDYSGCDTALSTFYAYNDTSAANIAIYNSHPPVQGAVFLNHKMSSFISFINHNGSIPNDPQLAQNYYYAMQAMANDTTHLTWGGNGWEGDSAVNFQFPSTPGEPNGWVAINNQMPQDIRSFGTIGPFNFNAGDVLHVDMAYVYARDTTGNSFGSINLLKDYVSHIRYLYQIDSFPDCGPSLVSIDEKNEKHDLKVYPVPASEVLFIEIPDYGNNIEYQIFNVTGQLLLNGKFNSKTNKIDISGLKTGLYIIKTQMNSKIITAKFIIQ